MSEIIDGLRYKADVEASPVVQKARQHLRSLQSQAEAARVAHDEAVGVELEGGEGSTTARASAKRRVDSLESEVEAAEHALSVAERRAVEKAHAAFRKDLNAQWDAVAKAAEKRAKVAERLEGALAEVAACYRELHSLGEDMRTNASNATPGGLPSGAFAKLNADRLLHAIKIHGVRQGIGLAAWPYSPHLAPTLSQEIAEANAVLLKCRPAA